MRPSCVIGHIKECRYIDTGQTLKDHFFNMKASHLNRASDERIQGCLFLRKLTNHLQQFSAQFMLKLEHISFITDPLPFTATKLILSPSLLRLIFEIGRNARAGCWCLLEHPERLRWRCDRDRKNARAESCD